jgi:hypothetical protein
MKRLMVLGASGVMGRRVVALAQRLLPGVGIVRASRHPPADGGDSRAIDVHDFESLRRGLVGVTAVINTVGPFEYDPSPLLRACQEAGCHCVDLAETPAFIARVEQEARSFPAESAVGVVSGCSTVPGLVQVLAQHWAGRDDVRGFRVLLGMGSNNPVSPTLLCSLLRPLGARAPDGSRYYDRLVRKRLRGLPARMYGRYPSSFDAGGLLVGERALPARFFAGMDRPESGYALWLAARVMPWVSSGVLQRLCRLAMPAVAVVQRFGTKVGVLSVEALDSRGKALEEIEVRAPSEGLNVPALPSVWAVRRLLADSEPLRGPLRLDQLFSPDQVIEWLGREGYGVTRRLYKTTLSSRPLVNRLATGGV